MTAIITTHDEDMFTISDDAGGLVFMGGEFFMHHDFICLAYSYSCMCIVTYHHHPYDVDEQNDFPLSVTRVCT